MQAVLAAVRAAVLDRNTLNDCLRKYDHPTKVHRIKAIRQCTEWPKVDSLLRPVPKIMTPCSTQVVSATEATEGLHKMLDGQLIRFCR